MVGCGFSAHRFLDLIQVATGEVRLDRGQPLVDAARSVDAGYRRITGGCPAEAGSFEPSATISGEARSPCCAVATGHDRVVAKAKAKAKAETKAKRQIALLRGINLGSQRRVSMGALRELVAGLGYEDVRTHLQSGNIVLTTPEKGERLQKALERAISAELGIEIEVIVRTRDELAKVVAHNPLADVADNPARYLVSFLSAKPDPKVVRELAKLNVAPEQFVVHGRELYAWHPTASRPRSSARRSPADASV